MAASPKDRAPRRIGSAQNRQRPVSRPARPIPRPQPRPTRAQLSAWAEAHEVELLFLDPPEVFDQAIVGIVTGFGQEPAVLYDREDCLAGLQRAGDPGGMADRDVAEEYFEFNTIGAFVGPATPRFLDVPLMPITAAPDPTPDPKTGPKTGTPDPHLGTPDDLPPE